MTEIIVSGPLPLGVSDTTKEQTMELPKRPFPLSKLNCLAGAVHPKYGLAWTDGVSVFLISVGDRLSSTTKLETDALPVDEEVEALFWNSSSMKEQGWE